MPLVSIVTALHNKGAYIADTIQSVLSQTMRDWEMIVVENGSNDDGPDIVSQFSDARISLVIADSTVRGPGAARNVGFQRAKGEWILFLDADDLITPSYLTQRLSILSDYPTAEIIAGPWRTFTDGSEERMETHYPSGWSPPYSRVPDSSYAYCPWILHSAIVRKDTFDCPEPWNPELDRNHAEDNAFWFRVVYRKTVHWDHNNGAFYRQGTTNSRDAEGVENLVRAFNATNETLLANRRFLKSMGIQPTNPMASTAVRVLEKLFNRTLPNEPLRAQIRRSIQREISDTSWLSITMMARRIGRRYA